jgi:hypothetical protein
VKHRPWLAVLATALTVLSFAGCGVTNHLQTISLQASGTSLGGGLYNLVGEGGILQLKAWANFSNKGSLDVTNQVTYTIVPTPGSDVDAFGETLPAPPQTVELSKTGLLSAVTPFTCTWVDTGSVATPAWFLSGSYQITATYKGVTSNPVYVAIASSAGSIDYPYKSGNDNNPTYQCGPTS